MDTPFWRLRRGLLQSLVVAQRLTYPTGNVKAGVRVEFWTILNAKVEGPQLKRTYPVVVRRGIVLLSGTRVAQFVCIVGGGLCRVIDGNVWLNNCTAKTPATAASMITAPSIALFLFEKSIQAGLRAFS